MSSNNAAIKTPPGVDAKRIACIALVALAEILFYGQPVGWTLGFYAALVLAALCLMHKGLLDTYESKFIALLLCGLVAVLVDAPQLLASLLFCAGVATLLVLRKRDGLQNAVLWLKDMLLVAGNVLCQWASDRRLLGRAILKKKIPASARAQALRRLLLPAVLAFVFTLLFTQANPILAHYLGVVDWDTEFSLAFSPLRWLFRLWFGIFIWALLRSGFKLAKPVTASLEKFDLARWIDKSSLVLSLVVFNTLFAVQNGLDIAFLWSSAGSMQNMLPRGLSYAEYAHEGAYPLIVTALVAAAYVLVTFDEHHRKHRTKTATVLVLAWITQNFFLVASSINRTLNYIDVYSLTGLRVAALIWMALVALGLWFIVLRICLRRSNMWLINANALALLGVLYGCCFINFDRLIADFNVRHAHQIAGNDNAVSLDLEYMKSLGPDAVPALEWYADNARLQPGEALCIRQTASTLRTDEKAEIDGNWRAWTWSAQND